MNAATMLAQSKTAYQAEIDAACEFIDFLRFNVFYMTEIYVRNARMAALPFKFNNTIFQETFLETQASHLSEPIDSWPHPSYSFYAG